jgi:hypothetical protein
MKVLNTNVTPDTKKVRIGSWVGFKMKERKEYKLLIIP